MELIDQDRNDEAMQIVLDMLDEDHDNSGALFQLSALLLDQGKRGLAYNVLARGCKLSPEIPEMWLNYGRSHNDGPSEWSRSEWCFRKAIKLGEKKGKPFPIAWASLATLSNEQCKYQDALKYADKALEIDPNYRNAKIAKGFTYLALGQWDAAWPFWRLLLDTQRREQYGYGDTTEWQGEPRRRVIVSGEQGIGDEIMYASIFSEVIRDSQEVTIDCMPRLQNLFQRSFPDAMFTGTRWDKKLEWPSGRELPECHVAMATLPQFYRHADSDFSGAPYLTPDPDMVNAAKGVLSALGERPKVGIAWTGGTSRTRSHLRTRTLEELLPILRQDCTWVSLEYNNRDEEIAEFREKRGIDIHTFHWMTEKGLDYDLTAALVSQLDLLITVPTTVSQMAGALGIECWVLVPRYTGWIFARETYPWASSVVPMRNPSIMQVAERLQKWLSTRTQTSSYLSLAG